MAFDQHVAPKISGPFLATPDPAEETRWLAWKAKGVESDRTSATTMRWLFIITMGAALVGLAGQAI